MNKLIEALDSLGSSAYFYGVDQKKLAARNALIALALPAGAPCTRLEFGWYRLKRTIYDYTTGTYIPVDEKRKGAVRTKLRPVDLFTGKVVCSYKPSEYYVPNDLAALSDRYWTEKKAEVFQYVFENTGYEMSELTSVEAFSNAMKNVSRTKWIYNALHALLELHLAMGGDERKAA